MNQDLDSVEDKFRMHEFSHIGGEHSEMRKEPSGAL
jgi:hypothetical protein